MTPRPTPPISAREVFGSLVAFQAVFWAQFGWVRSTNFWGYDEWLHLSLLAKGIIDFSYASRPLMLLWSLPAASLVPGSLTAFYVLHGVYLGLAGWLAFLLCRRLAPGHPALAWLTGVFTVDWAPLDSFRLMSVAMLTYPGATFGALLAILLLVESWIRRRPTLLALAALTAFVTARSFEGVLPLLACAPVALARSGGERRRLWSWIALWEGVVLAALALVLWATLVPAEGFSYQAGLGLDTNPWRVTRRLLAQFGYHLLPLVLVPQGPRELAVPAVAIAVALFVLVGLAVVRRAPLPAPEAGSRRFLLATALVGLLIAGVAYGPLVLSATVDVPVRTQFLSSAGIGLFLAADLCLLATWLPRGSRLAVVGLVAAWVVAVGSGRTAAMQREWDGISRFPAQRDTLRRLTARLPGLRPGTLVILIDERKAWPASFTFRHAVELLYAGGAIGFVPGAWDFGYPTSFAADGIRCEPLPALRRSWGVPVSVHRYDQTVVVRSTAGGELRLLERWPEALPPLPAGARYDPSALISAGGPAVPQRSVLEGP